jgi:hypothetical protein
LRPIAFLVHLALSILLAVTFICTYLSHLLIFTLLILKFFLSCPVDSQCPY